MQRESREERRVRPLTLAVAALILVQLLWGAASCLDAVAAASPTVARTVAAAVPTR